ncbi:MAG: 4-(cytidine 5'-diphospho)-2-C-methyl-D-erythritol kinase [Romboutsia sp.]
MNSIELKSRAKINLSIDVLGKKENGYHLVEMIMQTIDLYDTIKIEEIDTDDIVIKSNSNHIPLDDSNIAYKAIKILKNKFNISKGVSVYIDKNIPIAAGMAGGSSNAAAVIVGLNKLWGLEQSMEQLQEIGFKLGADVPFCISGQSALAQGVGEKLTYIKGLPQGTSILVCKPDLFVSTQEVYKGLDLNNMGKRPDNKYLIECLKNEDIKSLSENMSNVLETVTSKQHKEISEIEEIMNKNKALGSMMSGSGPTVFGLFKNHEDALKCRDILSNKYSQVYAVTSSEKGVEISG